MNAAYAKAAWPKRRDCNFIILSGKASLFGFGVCMMRCLKNGGCGTTPFPFRWSGTSVLCPRYMPTAPLASP